MGLMGMREGQTKIEIQWSRLLEGSMFEVTDGTPYCKWKYFQCRNFSQYWNGGATFMLTGSKI